MSDLATIEQLVLQARPQFEAVAVDRTVQFDREAGFAVQVLMGNEYAMRVGLMNQQSVINAVSNIAAIGLSLNPAKKQAYLVPRDGRICLDISYMGLLDLAIEGGSILWGQAELVHEQDHFTLHGVDEKPTHDRKPFATDRGPIVGVYVVVKTGSGDYLTTTMSIAEVFDIRDRSAAWKAWVNKQKKCPWVTDEGEMVKKTVIKRAYKLWPKVDKLDRAIHHLNTENEEGLALDREPLDQPKNFDLSPARAKAVREAAGEAIQKFNENNEAAAYDAVKNFTEEDEKLALWSILKPHSALRASIKKSSMAAHAKAQEEQQATDALDEVHQMKKAFGEI